METEGQKIQRLAFEAFGRWVTEFIEANPNAELSMLELADLYGKYGQKVIEEAKSGAIENSCKRAFEMTEHDLKVWPDYFQALAHGDKTFEIRKNDRGFQVGDLLRLREYEPGPDDYTGRELNAVVTYVMSGDDVMGYAFGIRDGFVALGLGNVTVDR